MCLCSCFDKLKNAFTNTYSESTINKNVYSSTIIIRIVTSVICSIFDIRRVHFHIILFRFFKAQVGSLLI